MSLLKKKWIKPLPYELIIFIIAIIAFYQVSFLQNSLKWDMIIGYGSSRYSVSQLLQENIFPLWRSYVSGGIPAYTNFSTSWSPLILIAGWLGNYTILTLHFFFILYIFIAGLGIFKLINNLISDRQIAFIAAVSYMLSGIMVSHAQHMDIIAGTAWLPWVIYSYISLSQKLKFQYVLQFSVVTYLLITDGYPAITICSIYLLIAIGIFELARYWRNNRKKVTRFITLNIGAIFLLLILSLGLIITFTEITPEISRFQQVEASKSNASPFTYQSFLSFIVPYATIEDGWFFKSNLSMRNAYFGIFLLFATSMGFFYKLPKIAWLFLASALIWLWAGLGDIFYLKTFFYKYVPGMNKFRSPSFFRIPALTSLIVYSSFSLRAIIHKSQTRKFRNGFTLYTIIFILIAIAALFYIDTDKLSLFSGLKHSQLSTRVFVQISIHILLLAIFLLIYKYKSKIIKTLLWMVPLDLILSVQLNMHSTIVSNVDPIEYYKEQIKHPRGFPIPSTNKIIQNTDELLRFGPSWLNGCLF